MDIHRPTDTTIALSQWERLYNILTKEIKAVVELVEPQPRLPDMTFTANAGLVYKGNFICSNFRYPQRQPEARFFSEWFRTKGCKVINLPEEHYFEGEGDALFSGDNLFAGYRFRSDIRSHKFVGEIIGKRVISMELIDPAFYHLDTCFCPIGDDTVIYYPDAFDSYANRVIKNYIPNRIVVDKKEALKFCCNAGVVGNNIIINKGSDRVNKRLRDSGYKVFEVELNEFLKAGGSAKCLMLMIN